MFARRLCIYNFQSFILFVGDKFKTKQTTKLSVNTYFFIVS